MSFDQKVRVKINEPIAVLADPDQVALDRKYAGISARMEANAAKAGVTLKPATIKAIIDRHKEQDRYGDVCRGIKFDKGYKPGDEVMLPIDLAQKWEDSGICSIIGDGPNKKAA